ncbi:MAG: hypothetical protein CME64_00690 [Halobacteriovoraceae bacterium]|nr:hypothetical protein [Halobacteriovoraceae bacterium]
MRKMEVGRRLTHYRPNEEVSFGQLKVKFSYKREDLDITIDKENLKFFTAGSTLPSYGLLLNSGQIGITLCLHYLKNKLQVSEIVSHTPAYVGSVEAMNLYGIKMAAQGQDLWICSGSFSKENLKAILSEKWRCVVIDSTCWALNEPVFKKLVDEISCDILFQIRSISKLDMGGEEYGSLGSLLIKGDEQLIELFREYYRLFSAAPSLCDITPELFNESKYQDNLNRVGNIVRNANQIAQEVGSISLPLHSKYFFLPFAEGGKEENIERQKLFLNLGRSYKLNIRSLRSFGFNFWNAEFFFNRVTNQHVARICPSSTTDIEEVEKFIFVLKLFLSKEKELVNI